MDDSYLYKRDGIWWYNRRVPSKYAHLDTRQRARKTLEARSIDTARILRDQLSEADEAYWVALSLSEDQSEGLLSEHVKAAQARYKAVQKRALAAGFPYKPIGTIVAEQNLGDTLERLLAVHSGANAEDKPKPQDAEALLGGAHVPRQRP